MKFLSFTFLFLLIITSCFNQKKVIGEGEITSKTFEIEKIDQIILTSACNVEIYKGASNKIVFSDYPNLIDFLDYDILNNQLIIKTNDENINIRKSKALAKIYLKENLREISIKGSGDVIVEDSFDGIESLRIEGSGDIDIEKRGFTQNLTLEILGSGDIDAAKIKADDADCFINGSGDIKLHVTDELKVSINGSGDIIYKGDPHISAEIKGSGDLKKSGLLN